MDGTGLSHVDWNKKMAPNDEMERLRAMLDREQVPWHDESDALICRTKGDEMRAVTEKGGGTYDQSVFSAICGYGAYGELELWAWPYKEDPRGFDAADEVMDEIRKVLRWLC